MMWLTFSNNKENYNANTQENTLSPYRSSPKWVIESFFIDIYWLLAHRIKGLGWSLNDFWACDTWTTSKLYCLEQELIKDEQRELAHEDEKDDSEEVRDLIEEMYGDESSL